MVNTLFNPNFIGDGVRSIDGVNWSAVPFRHNAAYIIFIDANDSNTIKALNGTTGAIDFGGSANAGGVSGSSAAAVINAAIAALTSGGKIFIRAGTYQLATTLLVNCPNITLEGEGSSTVFTLPSGASYDVIHVGYSASATGTIIRNLKINATNQTQSDTYLGICLRPTNSNNSTVEGCEVTATDHAGIWCAGAECLIRGNYIHNTYGDNITVEPQATNTLVTGNICDTTSIHNNISLVQVTDVVVANNQCLNSGVYGIAIENPTSTPCTGVEIIGNLIYNSAQDGIIVYAQSNSVDSLQHGKISHNVLVGVNNTNTASSGAITLGSGTDILVDGNLLFNCYNYGILTKTVATVITIRGNQIYSGTQTTLAIYLYATSTQTYITVSDNVIVSNASGAIGIEAAGTASPCIEFGQISGNLIQMTGGGGSQCLYLQYTQHFIISGNVCIAVDGIRELTGSDYNLIINNDVTQCTNASYLIQYTGTHTLIRGNIGYNPAAISSITAGSSPYTFPTLPYDAVYVITTVGGMSALTLDTQSLFNGSFTVGQQVYVAARHTLIATWTTTAPVFEILPI